ncbi:monocarboxylate transporter 1-like [Photinus pyralis]|uniref:monocarboxylate transporter 1-like n=1 Tax=Photinus pyralis TaxID=7054 RepID=UPI001266EF31|nr:monocarboxylate transporter 1-like [Photinus pyralis]
MASSKSSKSQCGLTTIVVNTSQLAKKVQLITDNTEIQNLDRQGEAIIVIPPDGMWGWVIVAASFIINFVNDGMVYTFALFLSDVSLSLRCSTTKVALANSILTGTYFLSGPLVGVFINTIGYRKVAVIGGIVTSLSLMLSSNCEELGCFILWYGLIGGLGLQMTFLSAIIVVSFYFEKWRALAQSIMSCGSSMGVTLFPLIFGILLSNQTWRVKFKVMSGCGLLCSFCALTFRPLIPVRVVEEQKVLETIKELPDEHDLTETSSFSNSEYTTASDRSTSKIMLHPTDQSSTSFFIKSVSPAASASVYTIQSQTKSKTSNVSKIKGSVNKLMTVLEEGEYTNLSCRDRIVLTYQRLCLSTTPARPLCRDDIFYPASLSTLPEYVKSGQLQISRPNSKGNIGYHLSVTRVSAKDKKSHTPYCFWFPKIATRMVDFSLLKSPSFILISFSGLCTVLGLYTPFMFIVQRAETNGIDRNIAYHLITAIGLANTMGRIASGMLSTFYRINTLLTSYDLL